MGAIRIMKRRMIPVEGFFLSIALCIVLLPAAFNAHAYSGNASGSSDAAAQQLLAETFFLPFTPDGVWTSLDDSAKPKPWEVEFITRQGKLGGFPALNGENVPTSVMQKGIYRGESYSLIAELGDMEISKSPLPSGALSYKGGKVSLRTGNSGNSLLLTTFTATSDRFTETLADPRQTERENVLAGVSGELSVFADRARLGTSLVTGSQLFRFRGKEGSTEGDKGSRTGIYTRIDPFAGRLVADAELIFSNLDIVTPDKSDAAYDNGYTLKLGGKTGSYGYEVSYKDPVPEYSVFGGEIVRNYRKVISINSRRDFAAHSIAMNLSRSSTGTQATSYCAWSRANEGALSYAYKGITVLPLGLEYRKRLSLSTYGAETGSSREYESDSVSGNVRYLNGILDWGLQGTLSQLNDRTTKTREQTASALTFHPRLIFRDITISPGLSIHRSNYFTVGQRVNTYSINLGAKRCNKQSKVHYEVNGGLKQTVSNPTDGLLKTITGNLRISAPFLNFFTLLGSPSLDIKGEYTRDNGKNLSPAYKDLTLSVTLNNL